MSTFIIRRLLFTVVVIFLVSFLAFILIHFIPGDPAVTMLGSSATPEKIAALRAELWLDRPLIIQYGHWLGNALHGDLGKSLMYYEPATKVIGRALPITLYLSGIALIISSLIGMSFGIVSATRRASFLDNLLSLIANAGSAIPVFWLGFIGIYFFSYKLGWLPIMGFSWPTQDFSKSLTQTIMPVICLGVHSMAMLARQTRSSMLEVMRQDYVRTAKAKGLNERTVTFRHALRNALIPVVTLLGVQVRTVIGGSVLVETVFNIPGMGRLLIHAALEKDFILVQACVLLLSIIACLANLVVDISYGWLDPRIRYR